VAIDLRACLNAISDVVNNRPRPLREFDQIFMKTADMLLQTEHVGRLFEGKQVIFIGDGDAIGLCLVHLHNQNLLEHGPKSIHVLDFDERVVLSMRGFAERFGISNRISAELYNVADALPQKHWEQFDCFYTNPPFGASNNGRSIEAFLRRGIEAVGNDAIGCLVLADHAKHPWTRDVLFATQRIVVQQGFMVSELLPEFHHDHLDDDPDLTSCSMVIRRVEYHPRAYASKPLESSMFPNFYGEGSHLQVRYIRDLTQGGKCPSRDYKVESLDHRGQDHERNCATRLHLYESGQPRP
jgi:N4-bis(aminopropyl)spermidine synthase